MKSEEVRCKLAAASLKIFKCFVLQIETVCINNERGSHVGAGFGRLLRLRRFFAVVYPFSQKGTLGSPVRLQARSRYFAVAATFLRGKRLRRNLISKPFDKHKILADFTFFLFLNHSSLKRPADFLESNE